MTKKKSDSVTFEAGGKTWTLRLGARVWVEVEDATGMGMNDAAQAIMNNGSFKTICNVMLAGLRRQEPELTMEQVFDIADEIGDEAVIMKVGEALEACFPTLKKNAGNVAKKA